MTARPDGTHRGAGRATRALAGRLAALVLGAAPGLWLGLGDALAQAPAREGARTTPSLLDPIGPVGAAQKAILFNSLAIMLAIVVPTIVATLAFAWWYRAGNARAQYRPDWAYSGRIELLVWAVPILIVLFLGGITWIGSHDLDPGQPVESVRGAKPVPVQIVSLDWKWLFIYPEQGIASVNEMVVPTGSPLPLSITSASVMNSFFVPQLGTMIYGMNGMAVGLNLRADRAGTYHGLSTHFSGDGFSDMHFDLKAVTQAEFDAWVEATRAAGGTLDAASYAELAKQTVEPPRQSYGAIDPDLFAAVVSQRIAPGPGPDKGMPNPGVTPKPLDGQSTRPQAVLDAPICTPTRPAGLRTASMRGELSLEK